MKKYLNNFEKHVFEKISSTGESYIVGGFVRSIVEGKVKPKTKNPMFTPINDVNDVDIVTTLTPDEVMELFSKEYVVEPYGKRYGTVAVCNESECIDITTMKEKIYINDKNTIEIIFGKDIKKDLLLRDFTINTLLINKDYQIIDILGAKKDIENKILRYVSSDFPRYVMDPIVLFRAARFASMGYRPTNEVIDSFYDPRAHERLQYVSRHRVLKELSKNSKAQLIPGLKLLHESDVLYKYFPQLEPHKKYIEEGIKTGNKKGFIEYILDNDPNPIEVFIILRINFKRVQIPSPTL